MIKWKVALLIICTVLAAIIIPVGGDLLAAHFDTVEVIPVKNAEIIDFEADDRYIGTYAVANGNLVTTFNVVEMLGLPEGAVVTVIAGYEDVASIENNVISFIIPDAVENGNAENGDEPTYPTFRTDDIAPRELSLTVNDGETPEYSIEFLVVNGVNILSSRDFYAFTTPRGSLNHTVVLQDDIYLEECRYQLDRLYDVNAYTIRKSFYGNGHTIFTYNFAKYWSNAALVFSCNGNVLRDTRFTGKVFEDGEEINLDELKDIGTLAMFTENHDENDGILVENCIFENSNRNVEVKNAKVHFKGCLFKNAADSNISMPSVEAGPSVLTLENCALATAVVGGILNWCTQKITEECLCTINLKGFVDFYCWKESESARIIPAYQSDLAFMDSILRDALKQKEFIDYLLKEGDNLYVSTAILAISTVGGVKNVPKVQGLEGQGMENAHLPIQAYSLFLTTSEFFGYSDDSKIAPTATLQDNPYLYYEMKYGR